MAEIKLTEQQKKEGYRVEQSGNGVSVWHHDNQIAFLLNSRNIDRKVQKVVERRRQEIKEVEEQTDWKPDR